MEPMGRVDVQGFQEPKPFGFSGSASPCALKPRFRAHAQEPPNRAIDGLGFRVV